MTVSRLFTKFKLGKATWNLSDIILSTCAHTNGKTFKNYVFVSVLAVTFINVFYSLNKIKFWVSDFISVTYTYLPKNHRTFLQRFKWHRWSVAPALTGLDNNLIVAWVIKSPRNWSQLPWLPPRNILIASAHLVWEPFRRHRGQCI